MKYRRDQVERGMYVTVDSEGRYRLYYDEEAYSFFVYEGTGQKRVYKKDLPVEFEVYDDLSWYDI